jgi:hypothetical protein
VTRRPEIDALRGLMLVLMTVTHLPTRYSNWLGQPFGFVSAAEGFIFLSGFMVGMLYTRRALNDGIGMMTKGLLRRAGVVWTCQAGMLLTLFTIIASIGLHTQAVPIRNLLSFYWADPPYALWTGMIMVYNPPLLDILPMYFLFMLASPIALAIGLQRNGWRVVIVASVALWLFAQLGMSHPFYKAVLALTGLQVPLKQTGAFEVVAWQFMWMFGMWMGSRELVPGERRPFANWVVVLAVVYATACLVWRHAVGQSPFGSAAEFNLMFDKWRLGPLRMLDFIALLVVVTTFGPRLAARMRFQWLETLGRASLPVFCAHVIVVLTTLATIGNRIGKMPLWIDTVFLAAVLAALYGIALLVNRTSGRAQKSRQLALQGTAG